MSDGKNNWALYYRLDAGRPDEFREIRQVGTAVWVRSGKVQTWGARTITECDTAEAADAEFQAACARQPADGFVLTREGTYDPARFDFEQLKNEIREGARQAFTSVRQAHPGKNVNAFALMTDDSAMTVGPVANSEEAWRESGGEEDFLWNPSEWSYTEGGEFLDIAYRLILPYHQDVPTEVEFEEFQAGVFEAGIRALEELDGEGFFGTGTARENVVLLFDVTDSDVPDDMAQRLNTPAMYARYQEWWDSWN